MKFLNLIFIICISDSSKDRTRERTWSDHNKSWHMPYQLYRTMHVLGFRRKIT